MADDNPIPPPPAPEPPPPAEAPEPAAPEHAEGEDHGKGKHKPRAYPRRKSKAKVECRRGALGSGKNFAISLVDLSEKGVGLIGSEAVDLGKTVEIRLTARGHNKPVLVLGKVVRCEPGPENTFGLGVRFEKNLSYSDFQRLT